VDWQTRPDLDLLSGRGPRLRLQWIEVLVFLLLVVPSMVLSLFAIRKGTIAFPIAAWATIFRDLGLVALVWYFLWRSGEPVRQIGWTARRLWRDVGIGVVLFPVVSLSIAWLERGLERAGLSAPSTQLPSFLAAEGPWQFALAGILVVVVAFSEETVFRGYLILRFAAVSRSLFWAVIVSSLVFSLGHGYEGSAGLVSVGVMGAIFALVYLWRGSLVAPMVMHFLQDFLGIVVAPLLSGS
jgi:membrane protease YdiL (CAAX protease family)